jgi:hypothetical protein
MQRLTSYLVWMTTSLVLISSYVDAKSLVPLTKSYGDNQAQQNAAKFQRHFLLP